MSRPTLTWRAHAVTGAALAFDLPADARVAEADADAFHNLAATRASLTISAWIGKDMSLAWWRGRFGGTGASLGAESAATICGRAGARQEVAVPARSATGLVPQAGGVRQVDERTPAQVQVAVSGTTRAGVPFVVAWIVDADQRDALRADEDHFFASLRCD